MTKRHYQLVADAMATTRPPDGQIAVGETVVWNRTLDQLVQSFAGDDPRFDSGRFIDAAGGFVSES